MTAHLALTSALALALVRPPLPLRAPAVRMAEVVDDAQAAEVEESTTKYTSGSQARWSYKMPTVDAAAKAAATAELESLESKGLITLDGQQSRHGLRGIDNPVDQWVVDNMGAFEVNSQLYLFDLAAIVLFALVGRATHGESVLDPIGDAFTMLPFLAAYFVAAQPLGAYAADATESYRRAATCLAPAWAAGTLGGTALRAVGKFALPPVGFVVANAVFLLVFLAAPRAYAVYAETGKLPTDEL